jgi:hypothetical protein
MTIRYCFCDIWRLNSYNDSGLNVCRSVLQRKWTLYDKHTGWSKGFCASDDYSIKNPQKYFKQFQSLTMITYLELGITDGVSASLVSMSGDWRGTLWAWLVTDCFVIIRCTETFWSPCSIRLRSCRNGHQRVLYKNQQNVVFFISSIPQRLDFMCQRFGTLYQLHRWCK